MAEQTEADFQRALTEAAALYGWRSCHTRKATVRSGRIATPTSVPGWPDLVLWNPERGGVLFVELKTDAGRVSPQQQEVIDSLRRAGAVVCVWRPKFWDGIQEVLRSGPLDFVRATWTTRTRVSCPMRTGSGSPPIAVRNVPPMPRAGVSNDRQP